MSVDRLVETCQKNPELLRTILEGFVGKNESNIQELIDTKWKAHLEKSGIQYNVIPAASLDDMKVRIHLTKAFCENVRTIDIFTTYYKLKNARPMYLKLPEQDVWCHIDHNSDWWYSHNPVSNTVKTQIKSAFVYVPIIHVNSFVRYIIEKHSFQLYSGCDYEERTLIGQTYLF